MHQICIPTSVKLVTIPEQKEASSNFDLKSGVKPNSLNNINLLQGSSKTLHIAKNSCHYIQSFNIYTGIYA